MKKSKFMEDAPLIEIHNATVWRETTCVFRNLSLCIAQGERVAVLGPNGSGKSTLLRTITRDIYPVHNKGSWIKVLGHEHLNVWELRSQIGIVSHDLQTDFVPDANVEQVILSGYFSSNGLDRRLMNQVGSEQFERAGNVMQQLDLQSLGKREFRTLSTGQQRRCLLGRALIHDPHTLVFDEPTSSLDMAGSFELLEHVRKLVKLGRGVVWVTHHMSDIPPEIERVIVLKHGAIIADGPKQQVLTRKVLSNAFDTKLRLAELDGYYLTYPAN
ncbi:MAG: iron complex transport system ATP-binding protein [Rhodothermales bacterium]|jgi:iron complex transport system ATP-binding protein